MDVIAVEVVLALSDKQLINKVEIAAGSSVEQAIDKSGILQELGNLPADIKELKHGVGVWGKVVSLNQQLKSGDRVEIYRPLLVDPMQARRNRAQQQKEERRMGKRQTEGGIAKRRAK